MTLTFLNSLRNQVLALLGLSLLPLGALTLHLSYDESRQAEADARDDAQATMDTARTNLNYAFSATRDLLDGLGRNPSLRESTPFCSELIAAIRPAYPHLLGIGVSDEAGLRLCSSEPNKRFAPVTTAGDHDAIIARVKATRRPVIARMGPTRGRVTLPFVGPVLRSDGEITEFIAASMDVAWLQERIAAIPITDGTTLLAFDRDGHLLGRNPPVSVGELATPVSAFYRELARAIPFEGQRNGTDGVQQFFYSAPVNAEDGISVIFTMPSRVIFFESRRKFRLYLIALTTVALFGVVLVWFGSGRFLAQPINRLKQAARRIGEGDSGARSGLVYSGEIGVLARSFDEMAEALQLARQHSESASAVLQSILQGTSNKTGEEFFQSLVLSLSAALEADLALVGEFLPARNAVQTLAVCHKAKPSPNFVFEISGTPFASLRTPATVCHYRVGVRGLFPQDQLLQDFQIESCLGTPLCDEYGTPVGLLAVFHTEPMSETIFDADSTLSIFASRAAGEIQRLHAERDLLQSISERNEAARKNEQMVEVLRQLTARLQTIREEERSEIAREIHDELGQQLTIMRFDAAALRKAILRLPDPDPLLQRVDSLRSALDVSIQDVRRIASELRPGVLDTFGPVAAIQWLTDQFQKRTGIPCIVRSPEQIDVSRDVATALFRICQESLTNVARHSKATLVEIDISVRKSGVAIEISDNGTGVREGVLPAVQSLGVLGMQERARMVNGMMEIGNGRLGGVTVSALLPTGLAARGAVAG